MPAIRPVREDDVPAMLEILSPFVRDTIISFELTPPTADEFLQRVRDVLRAAPWIVFEEDGRVVGYAYASRFRSRAGYRWSVETSIYVHSEFHGRGIGRALYATLIELLRLQGYRLVIGGIALPNDASVALHETMGFVRTAAFANVGYKLGRWIDVGFWELELFPPVENPPEPLSLAEAMATPQWARALSRRDGATH